MLTMLIGGLWHGASWNFVVWGGLHGSFLAIERLVNNKWGHVGYKEQLWFQLSMVLFTYMMVNVTWVFFRASDFAVSAGIISAMFGFAPEGAATPLPTLYIVQVSIVIIALLAAHWFMRNTSLEAIYAKAPAWLVALLLGFMAFAVIISQGTGNAFIYFQF
jgi:alginate O-acetyltransferase complex protein AlgI